MRWTWLRRQTTGADTDGQVVWLWHPDADAKFAPMLTHRADDGGQKARRTGESTKQPLKPLRREGRLLAEPVVLPRAFCCTRTMGISGYPVFPAPSL
jgi:hypothetical protein